MIVKSHDQLSGITIHVLDLDEGAGCAPYLEGAGEGGFENLIVIAVGQNDALQFAVFVDVFADADQEMPGGILFPDLIQRIGHLDREIMLYIRKNIHGNVVVRVKC